MNRTPRIFTLSPGSTSTKIAVFDGDECLFKSNITHEPDRLRQFKRVNDQLPYRLDAVYLELNSRNITLDSFDAFSAYSGGLVSTPSGIFPVNKVIIDDCTSGRLFEHPAILGAQIIHSFAEQTGKPAYLVNPPDCDEFCDIARISGVKGIYRESHVHVLNQKEVAFRTAEALGKAYEECNFVVCHIGGGLSITAHESGRIVDGNDVLSGEGPMAPNRSGNVPVIPIIKLCYSGDYSQVEMEQKISKFGGLLGLLGTDDVREIRKRITSGDQWSKLCYNAMAYQLAKQIGSYACVLRGKTDAIVLTGGVSNDYLFVNMVTMYTSWIAPILVYAGDFEMEALAAGAIRALSGKERTKEYSGIPVWSGFDYEY